MWFNQSPAGAPIPAWEKTWFASRNFRVAVSLALNREMTWCAVAYDGHATAANDFISPVNTFWRDAQAARDCTKIKCRCVEPAWGADGFRKQGKTVLVDREGPPREVFDPDECGQSRARKACASLIQQDLLASLACR